MDLVPAREREQVRSKLRLYNQEEHDLPVCIIWSITILVPCLVAITAFLMTTLNIGISNIKWAAFDKAGGDLVMCPLVLIVFGVVLSGAAASLVYFFAPICAGSGLPEAKGYLNGNHIPGLFTGQAFVVRALGAVLAVTSGFPIGREGPMVCIGGTIGVGVVHLLALPYVRNWVVLDKAESSALGLFVDEERFELAKRLGCVIGGAAGIACAFNAPIGGIMYMFEEVTVTNWVPELFFRSFVCTVVAAYLCRLLSEGFLHGSEYFLIFQADHLGHDWFHWFEHWVDVPFFIFVALVCGVVSSVFARGLAYVWSFRRRTRHRLQECHPWAKIWECMFYAAIVALVLAVVPAFWGCENILGASEARRLNMTRAEHEVAHAEASVHSLEYREYNCDDGQHNEVATLLLNRGVEGAIKHLYHRYAEGALSPGALAITFVAYIILAVGMPGLSVPMGMFMPCMLMGALIGRFFAEIFKEQGLQLADPGIYAMIGSAAMLSGFTHMTLAIVVLLVEVNHDLTLVPPLMLGIFVAQVVSKLITTHAYDEVLIHKKEVPFLEAEIPKALDQNDIFAKDLCEVVPVEAHLPPKASVASVQLALEERDVFNFPVLQGKACIGIITRVKLEAALKSLDDATVLTSDTKGSAQKDAEFAAVPVNKRLHALERTITKALNEEKYFQDVLGGKGAGPLVDIRRIMDPAPYMILEDTPALRLYDLFAKGITTVACVVSPLGHFHGILSRTKLIEATAEYGLPRTHGGWLSRLESSFFHMFPERGASDAGDVGTGQSEGQAHDAAELDTEHQTHGELHDDGQPLKENADHDGSDRHDNEEDEDDEKGIGDAHAVGDEKKFEEEEEEEEIFSDRADVETKEERPLHSHRLPPKVTWAVTFTVPIIVAFVAFLMTFMEGVFAVSIKFKAVQAVMDSGVFGGMLTLVAFAGAYSAMASALVTYFAPICAGSGIPEAKGYLNGNTCDELFSLQTLLVRTFCAILAVSAGYPIGREGPLVCIGGTIGYGVVHMFGRSYVRGSLDKSDSLSSICIDESRFAAVHRVGFVMGGAAGIAVAFNAPIGGILYLLEENGVTSWPPLLTFQAFVCTVVAIYASSFFNFLRGTHHAPLLIYFGERQIFDWTPVDIPWFVILAVCLGLFSAIFAKGLAFVAANRRRSREHPAVKSRMPRIIILECIVYACFVAFIFALVPLSMGCSPLPNSHRVHDVLTHANPIGTGHTGMGDAGAGHTGMAGHTGVGHVGAGHTGMDSASVGHAAVGEDVAAGHEVGYGTAAPTSAPLPSPVLPPPAPAAHPDEHDNLEHHDTANRRLNGALEGAHHLSYVQYTCKDGEYNELASLLLNPAEAAVHHLYLRSEHPFSLTCLIVAVIAYAALALGMPGLCVPMGMFIPSMMIGALAGRFLGGAVGGLQPDAIAHEGVYAMVGSAAMLAGFTHFTISIVVLLVEVTQDLSIIVPLMLAIFIAHSMSKIINHHAFDEVMIHMKHIPFLDPEVPPAIKDKTAAHICRTLPEDALLPPQASIDEVKKALDSKDIECFPVLDDTSCIGTITRHHLELALRAADSSYEIPVAKVHSHEVNIAPAQLARQYPEVQKLKIHTVYHETVENDAFLLEHAHHIGVAERVQDVCRHSDDCSTIPISAIMDAGPYVILDTMPVSRFYLMFTKIGARTVVVMTKRGEFCGTVSRADVIAASHHWHRDHSGRYDGQEKAKPVKPRKRQEDTEKANAGSGSHEPEWSENLLEEDSQHDSSEPSVQPPAPPPKEGNPFALPVVTHGMPLQASSPEKPIIPLSDLQTFRQRFFAEHGTESATRPMKVSYEEDHPPEEVHGDQKMADDTPMKEEYHAEAEADHYTDELADGLHTAADENKADGSHTEPAATESGVDDASGLHHPPEGLFNPPKGPHPEVIGSKDDEDEEDRMDDSGHWDGFVASDGPVMSTDTRPPTDTRPLDSQDDSHANEAVARQILQSGVPVTAAALEALTAEDGKRTAHEQMERTIEPEVIGSSDSLVKAERAGTEGYVDVTGTSWQNDTPTQLARAPVRQVPNSNCPRYVSGVMNGVAMVPRAVARTMSNCGGMDQFCLERLPRHLANIV